MREIYFTRRIIITLLVLYILLQLLVYFNCLLLVKDLETVINAHAGRYGGRIDINRLIIVSKEYGIYEDAYKTAFTKIGIAFSVLIVYIIYIYRTKNKTQLLKDAMLLIKEQKITESKQENQWIDTPITLSSVYYRSLDLYQFKNNLFYIRGSESNEKNVKKMFVLDTKNMKLEKEVPIAANCFIDSVNIIKDTLNISVQHYTEKLDMLHYIFFWLRRGRPEKYEYIVDSTATYKFDKNFKRI